MKKLFSALVLGLALASVNVTLLPIAAQAADSHPAATEKLDINTATAEQLAQLPGIGPARAKDIVKGRPYTGKDDLVKKKIIPQSVYDKIKDNIIARQGMKVIP